MANGNLNRVEQGSLVCKICSAWLPWRTITARKSGDESSAKWRLEDKVWKVGNMAKTIMGLVVYNVAWAEAYLRTKWHLDPSSRLATTDMGRKLGAVLFWGELDPYLTQCDRGRGLHPCQVSPWSIQPFGNNTPTLQTGQTGLTTVR